MADVPHRRPTKNQDWNRKGRTVQNNTPCCGSRPPAYPSFSRMGKFFRRVKHRRSLGHRIRLRQEIQSGSRGRWWIPVELVSKVSETREQSWILLGDRPPAYPSFSRMGTFLGVSSTGGHLGTGLDPVCHQT